MNRGHLHLLRQASPLAGKTVTVHPAKGTEFENLIDGAKFVVEDWCDNVNDETWQASAGNGNFACLHYLRRVMASNLPLDNDVLYGHIGHLGYLVHVREVEAPQEAEAARDVTDAPAFDVPFAGRSWRDYHGDIEDEWDDEPAAA